MADVWPYVGPSENGQQARAAQRADPGPTGDAERLVSGPEPTTSSQLLLGMAVFEYGIKGGPAGPLVL